MGADEIPVRIYAFGDQTYNIVPILSHLIRVSDDAVLVDFLQRSTAILKHEVTCLRPEQRARCPRFTGIADLLPYYANQTLNPAFVQALTCITQLGMFIREHSSTGTEFPTQADACLVGVCTGALTAAAVSCSSSISNLQPLALRTVTVTFRLGALAWEVASRLVPEGLDEEGDVRFPSWTWAVSGATQKTIQDALQRFATERCLPPHTVPWVSANVGSTQLSLSGSPEMMSSFFTAFQTANLNATSLPIIGPYHAPHLYSEEDVEGVLSCLPTCSSETAWPVTQIPIISIAGSDSSNDTSTDALSTAFPVALGKAVNDCLMKTLSLDTMHIRIADSIRGRGLRSFKAYPMALAFEDRFAPQITSYLRAAPPSRVPPVAAITRVQSDPRLPLPAMPAHKPAAASPIAIIAASGRFPRAANMESFWELLAHGVDTHEIVPPSRWDHSAHVSDATKLEKNVSGTGYGCWLHNAGQFDATFFNMSPREAPQVDPAQRLALLTAAEALEQAGIVPDRTSSTRKNRVGVYFGCTSNDWMETNSAQNIDTYFIPGGNRAFIPGRVNYHFKFSGPSFTIDTACSSSLAAVHMACNALWQNEIDTAIVGGTNVLTNPDMTAGLDRGHFLSRTGNCKTFDDEADGYCRGEAVVSMILKRVADAQADKDSIQCCILGVATNHSAEADSITRPHVGAQQDLFERLLATTGVSANEISYVEMHGTGTQAGDAGETKSVVETLSPLTSSGSSVRPASLPLHIGAAKSNVGHGEAAAGLTSLAKVLLMLKHSQIPPHAGIETKLNHRLPDIRARNTHIAKTLTYWPRRQGSKRRVLLNNFSAAGGNTALILEDAPVIDTQGGPDPRSHHIVSISAKSSGALVANMRSLVAWISSQSDGDSLTLPRLSYSTTARRTHHRHRVAVTGTCLREIKAALQEHIGRHEQGMKSVPHPPQGPSFIFGFTGQGSAFEGMGAHLYRGYSSFRTDILRYDQICAQMHFPSIRAMFEAQGKEAALEFENASPTKLQLTHVCFQMALFRLLTSIGIRPAVVVGHSLGEYSALYAAGSLSQIEVIHLVGQRAQLIEKHLTLGTHAMLVVRAKEEIIAAALLHQEYQVSCRNTERNIVLGGTVQQMSSARDILEAKGVRCQYLDTPIAFHSSQVDPILDEFGNIVSGIQFRSPKIPIVSPTYRMVLRRTSDFKRYYLVEHCRSSVDISVALQNAQDEGVLKKDIVGLEIGPAPVVMNFVKDIVGTSMPAFSAVGKDQDTWQLLTHALSHVYVAGSAIEWSRYHEDFVSAQHVLELPAYAWDLKEYWLQYVHNWSLRKGDPPVLVATPTLESSSVQKVLTNTLSAGGDGELVVDANLSRKDLYPMVQGHHVYGVPLCTPSVYADIALTIGEHIKTIIESASSAVNVANMNIQSALVASDPDRPRILRTAVKFDSKKAAASCTFSSTSDDGSKVTEQHANCEILFEDVDQSQRDIELTAHGAKASIDALHGQVGHNSNTYRFSKSMIYKMIGQLADFDEKYRGLCAITLDNNAMEAAGMVSFKGIPTEGTFHTSPAYLDALSQLGGFVMNANEGVDLDKEVFVNHGWKSLRFFKKLDPRMTYYSHVKMKEAQDKLWTGNVIIFDENNETIGMVEGVALQGVPKRLMHYIVTAANKKAQGEKKATTTPIPGAVTSKTPQQSSPAAHVSLPPRPVTALRKEDAKLIAESKLFAGALKIISEEIGVAEEELNDDIEFADAGLDSLLSLVISSRLRDELEIDFESGDLLNIGSIRALRLYFEELSPSTTTKEAVEIAEKILEPVVLPAVVDSLTSGADDGAWPGALNILSEESGIATSDLVDEVAFADVGVDSLMSLVVCSRLRDELEIDFPDRALFEDCLTVGDLRGRISPSTDGSEPGTPPSLDSGSESDSPPLTGRSTPPDERLYMENDALDATLFLSDDTPLTELTEHDSLSTGEQKKAAAESAGVPKQVLAPAWSMALQGSSKSAEKTLFLFPDGCGAATSYLSLPRVARSTAICAFNSPFIKKPHEMTRYSFKEVIACYVDGIKSRQTHGPYCLGGWSAGGILAYAVAQQLIAAGEAVSTLLLIDSPCPNKGLDRLPDRFFDHCTEVGLFGTEMQRGSNGQGTAGRAAAKSPAPDWLMPHFRASIELLHDYHAPPMSPSSASSINVCVIWAGECAFDGERYPHLPPSSSESDEDTEGMKFLTEKRKDFGPGDWAELFPSTTVRTHTVEREHHFSMMRDQGAEKLVQYIREALNP